MEMLKEFQEETVEEILVLVGDMSTGGEGRKEIETVLGTLKPRNPIERVARRLEVIH